MWLLLVIFIGGYGVEPSITASGRYESKELCEYAAESIQVVFAKKDKDRRPDFVCVPTEKPEVQAKRYQAM